MGIALVVPSFPSIVGEGLVTGRDATTDGQVEMEASDYK
jgi:hypothetical protein